jgi:hypothetical protein
MYLDRPCFACAPTSPRIGLLEVGICLRLRVPPFNGRKNTSSMRRSVLRSPYFSGGSFAGSASFLLQARGKRRVGDHRQLDRRQYRPYRVDDHHLYLGLVRPTSARSGCNLGVPFGEKRAPTVENQIVGFGNDYRGLLIGPRRSEPVRENECRSSYRRYSAGASSPYRPDLFCRDDPCPR